MQATELPFPPALDLCFLRKESSLDIYPEITETAWLCSYEDGMFTEEEPEKDSFLALLTEQKAVAIHEAGHAALDYVTGRGCKSVSITQTIFANGTTAFSGIAKSKHFGTDTIRKKILKHGYCKHALAHGVTCCAGPAAERKFRRLNGCPIRNGSEDDHKNIDGVGKTIESEHQRCRFAYRRLTWRVAQRAIDLEPIWDAIEHIADVLLSELEDIYPQDDAPGEYTATIAGSDVKAIMRRHKAKIGMLGFAL